MTLQEILSANRELVINNYNSNIQLRNYTQMSLREYMLGVMAWFADHSGSARKWLPVMNSTNKAMKATPYSYKTKYGDKLVEAATMFDINKAIMRCLAKNIAMFGLGLYIYAGEDLPEEEVAQAKSDLQAKIDEACAKMRAVTSRKELEEVWREYSKTVPVEQGSAFMTALQEMAQQYPKPQ